MKVFGNTFIHSLKLPQKKAVFALNRIGMDVTVIYMFLLLAISSIPALLDQLGVNDTTGQVHPFFLFIYFFIFYYLILVLIIFTMLSLIAYIATLIARGLKRKLRFSILWKMSAFSATLPLVLFTIFSFMYQLNYLFLLICIIYMIVIILKAILIYPRRQNR